MELDALDRQRERWSRARRPRRMETTEDASFAAGGLGSTIESLIARLLVLPADPLAGNIDLNEELRAWWTGSFDDPIIQGRQMGWGTDSLITEDAILRGTAVGDHKWYRYLAIDRSAALDIGLGTELGRRSEHGGRILLTRTVGRVWCGLELYRQIALRSGLLPPLEVSLGLKGTRGALLAGLAEGWRTPEPFSGDQPCSKENVLIQRELFDFTENWPREVAFKIGAQIENAFGTTHQRFVSRSGDYADHLDPRRCNWE